MRNNPIQITRQKSLSRRIEPFETGETIILSVEQKDLLDALAGVLEYPTADWFGRFEKCKALSFSVERPGAEYFSEFCEDTHRFSLLELQELYTRTFDLNPVCALEIGYHLFGEDYKRGEFLARLSETEDPYQLGQEKQLPDFLPVILRLLGRLEDRELRASLIGYCLIPALQKMCDTFEKKKNLYGNVIRFLMETLKQIAERSVSENEESQELRYQYA